MVSIQYEMEPLEPHERPEDRIRSKHKEYHAAAKRYRLLYYGTRLIGGLCAGILPFVVYSSPSAATALSVAIVVVTVFDVVFNPKDLENYFARFRSSFHSRPQEAGKIR
jgi:hypothetical protein